MAADLTPAKAVPDEVRQKLHDLLEDLASDAVANQESAVPEFVRKELDEILNDVPAPQPPPDAVAVDARCADYEAQLVAIRGELQKAKERKALANRALTEVNQDNARLLREVDELRTQLYELIKAVAPDALERGAPELAAGG